MARPPKFGVAMQRLQISVKPTTERSLYEIANAAADAARASASDPSEKILISDVARVALAMFIERHQKDPAAAMRRLLKHKALRP